MSRQNVEFKSSDHVTLRGWLYTPSKATEATSKLPCLVMSHGFSALKEMELDSFAEYFVSRLTLACLVFDNRGFGESDTLPGLPRQEIIPAVQISDISDAITYAQSRGEIDPSRIAVWGSSYSGGNVLAVGAADRRVKAVLTQAPLVDGWENFHRLIRPDFIPGLNQLFEADRLARAAGKPAGVLPVVDENPMATSALPTADSFKFFSEWEKKSSWKNEITIKSMDVFRGYNPSAGIHNIAPTPLLMTVADEDVLTPTPLALEAFSRAREPKELHLLSGGHFEAYTGPNFERNAGRQVEFLKKWLCDK